MDTDTLHDLTAAYALDALEAEEAREYEAHLARCERCREELVSLSEASTALAFAVEGPAPAKELRSRILQQARRERPNVVPLRPRWAVPAAAVAAVAACAAIGLGIWAASLSSKLDSRSAVLRQEQRLAGILSDPAARRVTISGGRGTLVVTSSGDGALVLNRLAPAGSGRTYEAWVAEGATPEPAGLFDGGREVVAFPLDHAVPNGATVMVTKEDSGGTDAPTQTPFVTVRNEAGATQS